MINFFLDSGNIGCPSFLVNLDLMKITYFMDKLKKFIMKFLVYFALQFLIKLSLFNNLDLAPIRN